MTAQANEESPAPGPNGQGAGRPLVFACVLHWQGSQYTRACLASLRALGYANLRILLVDNGSPDASGAHIAGQFPEVEFLAIDRNLGFSGGCNAAIEYSLARGADFVWLLNNDTRVAPGSLDHLVDAAQARPDSGAIGAVVYTGSGEQFVASGPGTVDFVRAKTHLRQLKSDSQAPVDCQWLSGSNLLLRRAAIESAGVFDESYFLYFEDTDLCLRYGLAGWKCLLVPAARIEHAGGASTEGERAYWRAYYYTRNRFLFFFKHRRGPARILPLAYMASHLLRHAIVLPFRGDGGRSQLRAEYLGARDYFLKRLGKAQCLDWCS